MSPFDQLYQACTYGRLEEVQRLLENNVKPTALNTGRFYEERLIWTSPLHQAIHHCNNWGREKRHRKIVKLLIREGADVNLHNGFNTPLQLAVMRGSEKIVQMLLSNGAQADKECIQLAGANTNILKLLNIKSIPQDFLENPYKWIKSPVGDLPIFGEEKYKYLRPLGEGAFGVVFLAEKVSDGQQVAIKLLLCKNDQEDKMLSLIQSRGGHPNIVTFYDSYQEWGKTWILMEYIEGKKLIEVWESLSPQDQIKINQEIGSATQFIRAARVTSERENDRENVMVTTINGRPTAKLIDFGTLAQS